MSHQFKPGVATGHDVQRIHELAKEKGLKGLKQRFQTVALEYNRLYDEMSLPHLKISNKNIQERRHGKNAFEPRVHRH